MSGLLVDADAIRALAEILTETGLTEIEVSEKDRRIRVARAPATVQAAAPAPVAPVAPVAAAPAAGESAAPADFSRHPGAVSSPMVGVAYLTPDPSSPPFVSEGQIVTAGQTLMLIEAMKTFNQIKAPRGGTLKAILVASGDPVEFGQPLAIIE
ncbi:MULTISPECIES: acetyl-CoA carboxylase biotin carboxyl carrier protein [Acetobacter]|jgi:acetyl-CoA carboxylase biotin carboxyl carrier protein|uniref:Biotin carboxyl carrier protein of acetyl-CoA carboxylase n=1 Tax=Acetobacter lovaniensis TaxID=104100 RepID=A0A841QF83_9PROT|nr:acetyl-CoA carboxylase biotin carboxyl carrier protein subunit [Acetobacter lovaniensis]MBB6457045.1 acetyl-CoA carboxylase biotin carboxyl carrier protein [Acetobacter lovaniensis]MCI1697631.1 acetyl-CoA carboxylase biotin carboxyl carrier protein [Acetobacter lovaniensis]MCI1795914.1 acetyl-CoA carboxylase biotin carboxyl carrier protein [Acetobacter lovaniensis]MCP1239608.1 acetyl-CoA carboxylase biotin carboxyl carrier protein [Acetobacter lovaniensis]NHN81367.1 acetyl-CoA carboxylase b